MKLSNTCFAIIKALIEGDPVQTYYQDLLPFVNSDMNIEEVILLPNIMLWDPLGTKMVEKLKCPHCMRDGIEEPLKVTGEWHWGPSSARMPRCIWDSGWYCALVGRVYKCWRRKHKMASFHDGINDQIPASKLLFLLTYKTGVTYTFFDQLLRYVEAGIGFPSMELLLGEMFVDKIYRRKMFHGVTCDIQVNELFGKPSPNDQLIRQYFLSYYETYKHSLAKEMRRIPLQVLTFHTLKLTCSIGYYVDKKWIKGSDSVFLALNEQGCMKGYKLFNSLRIGRDRCREMLSDLIANCNPPPEVVLVDECCSLREELAGVFPRTVFKMKLNAPTSECLANAMCGNPLGHAALPRKFAMIFRFVGDVGDTRRMSTPPPSVIEKNLEKCMSDCTLGNAKKQDALVSLQPQLEKLKKHIQNGCLSDIPPYQCLSVNDVLLKRLNSMISTQIGAQTVHALFMHYIYTYNVKKKFDAKEIMVPPPIWCLYESRIPSSDVQATLRSENGLSGIDESNVFQQLRERFVIGSDEMDDAAADGLSSKSQRILSIACACSEVSLQLIDVLKTSLHSYLLFPALLSNQKDAVQCFANFRKLEPLDEKKKDDLIKLCKMDPKFMSDDKSNESFIHCMCQSIRQLCDASLVSLDYKEHIYSFGIFDEDIAVATSAFRKLLYVELAGENHTLYRQHCATDEYESLIDRFLTGDSSDGIEDVLPLVAANVFGVPLVVVPLYDKSNIITILPVFNIQIVRFPVFLLYYKNNVSHVFATLCKPKKEEHSPDLKKPSPMLENLSPVLKKPLPVSENLSPVFGNQHLDLENSLPVLENSTPVLENSTPVLENPTPVLENPPPVSKNPLPVSDSPAPDLETLAQVVEASYCQCGMSDRKPKKRCTVLRCSCYKNKRGCSTQCKCRGCENGKELTSEAVDTPRRGKRPRPVSDRITFSAAFGYVLSKADINMTPAQHFLLESCMFYSLNDIEVEETSCDLTELLLGLYENVCTEIRSLKDWDDNFSLQCFRSPFSTSVLKDWETKRHSHVDVLKRKENKL